MNDLQRDIETAKNWIVEKGHGIITETGIDDKSIEMKLELESFSAVLNSLGEIHLITHPDKPMTEIAMLQVTHTLNGFVEGFIRGRRKMKNEGYCEMKKWVT